MATPSTLPELDPLDAFALDALLAAELQSTAVPSPSTAQPVPPGSLSGQAALAAFLAEMDAFDHELRDAGSCRASFDLTPLPAAAATATDLSATSGAARSQAPAAGATPKPSKPNATRTRPSTPFDPVPTAIHQQQAQSGQRSHADSKEAFSLFAQRTALAFALEPARPLKRKRRIRAKEEIDTLRDTAESLARDLETIKDRQQQRSTNASPVVTTSISVLTDIDKRGAAAALEANRKLRKTVDAQLQFAGKMNEKLLSHVNAERQTLRLARTTEVFEKPAPLTDADFAVFYEALTGKLDAIYSQWDKMIVARNLAKAKATFQDARVEVSDDNVATLYFSDEKVLPFDFQSVNDACWVCAKMDSVLEEGRGGITDLLPRDDDVVLVKKAFPLPLANNEEAAIPVRSVFKRFVSKGRVVFCWEGTAEWPGELVNDPDAKTSPMRENGWGLVRPMPDNPKLCHVQVCVRMKPGLSDERMLDVPAQVEQLTRMVIPAYQRMISWRFQMIENLLLDKYLRT